KPVPLAPGKTPAPIFMKIVIINIFIYPSLRHVRRPPTRYPRYRGFVRRESSLAAKVAAQQTGLRASCGRFGSGYVCPDPRQERTRQHSRTEVVSGDD